MDEPVARRRSGPLPVLRWWWVAVTAALTMTLTGLAMWWLLASVGNTANTDLASAELDAIRTSLSVGVGAGGAFALWLAARRQRSTELELNETARIAADTRTHQERVALATEEDLRERRITDLYTKAVEQLGAEKAPVRLGSLYALERLADSYPSHRQTVVNVICAYLRMPYSPPPGFNGIPHTPNRPRTSIPEDVLPVQEELHVRLTAQQIIIDHLRPTQQGEGTAFWADLDLDLTGATLVDFRMVD